MSDEQAQTPKIDPAGQEPEPPENHTATEGYSVFYSPQEARRKQWAATWPGMHFVIVGTKQIDQYLVNGYRVLESEPHKVGVPDQVLMGIPQQVKDARMKAKEAAWKADDSQTRRVGDQLVRDLSPEATDLLGRPGGNEGFVPVDS